jgi:Type III restriction enzyme, res subunit/Transposase, Mutator family
MEDRLIRIAAFQNPEFYKAQAMRISTYGKPRVISCSESFPEHIGLPRGCLEDVLNIFKRHGVRTEVQDERTVGQRIDVSFHAELRAEQLDAANQVLAHVQGILSAPTAFGKTVVGAYFIARRAVGTLVLVHRRQLMDQWRERLAAFLELPISNIGQFGGGKNKRTGLVDVAVIQSLQNKGSVQDFVVEYGHVIVAECHHLSVGGRNSENLGPTELSDIYISKPADVLSLSESQWRSLCTTNAIERMQLEFWRRVKTLAALPNEGAVLRVFFGLWISGQMKLHRISGYRDIGRREKAAA